MRQTEVLSSFAVEQTRKKLDQWGIQAVCFDFDDTLIDTNFVFVQAIKDVCYSLGGENNWEKLRAEFFSPAITALRQKLQVNPVIMEAAALITLKGLEAKNGGQVISAAKREWLMERVRRIYQGDTPPVFPGAFEAVDLFNATGRETILATHAEEKTTRFKKEATGFSGKFTATCCFDVNIPKAGQWQRLFRERDLDPQTVLVIGDNLAADILPTIRQGARAIWVYDFNKPLSIHGKIELSPEDEQLIAEKVIQIHNIGKISCVFL